MNTNDLNVTMDNHKERATLAPCPCCAACLELAKGVEGLISTLMQQGTVTNQKWLEMDMRQVRIVKLYLETNMARSKKAAQRSC